MQYHHHFYYHCSVAQSGLILSDPMGCSTPGFPFHHHLLELAQTHVHRVSDDIQPSHPLSSPSSPVFNLSHHQGFFPNELVLCTRWPKFWTSASALLMNIQDCFPLGFTGLISLLSKGPSRVFSQTRVQRLWYSAFFMVQLSHPYRTTGKNMWREGKGREVTQSCLPLCHSKDCSLPGSSVHGIFVGKIMSLLFNTLCRFVIAFLPRSKSLNFMVAITTCRMNGKLQHRNEWKQKNCMKTTKWSDFEDQHNKVCYCFHCFSIYLTWNDMAGFHNLSLLNVEGFLIYIF